MRVLLTEVAYMYLSMEMKKFYWFDNIDSPPLSVLFTTIGIRAGPLVEAWLLEGDP